jgi:hypothetical protein
MCRVFFYLAMGTRPDGWGSSQEDEGQGKQGGADNYPGLCAVIFKKGGKVG